MVIVIWGAWDGRHRICALCFFSSPELTPLVHTKYGRWSTRVRPSSKPICFSKRASCSKVTTRGETNRCFEPNLLLRDELRAPPKPHARHQRRHGCCTRGEAPTPAIPRALTDPDEAGRVPIMAAALSAGETEAGGPRCDLIKSSRRRPSAVTEATTMMFSFSLPAMSACTDSAATSAYARTPFC